MRNLRRQLPPLDALVGFEAAARHLSFTRAAEELNLTQAAVSRHIRVLEENLGVRLFIRSHRTVELTAQGREFQHTVRMVLVHLANSATQIRDVPLANLSVAVDQSIAALWLTPRLPQFRKAFPDVSIRLIVSDYEADCRKDEIDVAIIHGDGRWTGYRVEMLLEEEIFPVCSPAYLEQSGPISAPSDLIKHTLVDLEDDHWDWMNWRTWLTTNNVELPSEYNRLQINNYPVVIQAARDGQGVALGWRYLVDDFLMRGDLVRPLPTTVTTEFGYHLLVHDDRPLTPDVEAFISWVFDAQRRARKDSTSAIPSFEPQHRKTENLS